MAKCRGCFNYSQLDDDMRRVWNDDVGPDYDPDAHFCLMYEDGIPKGVYNSSKDCRFYKPKDFYESKDPD